MKVTAKSLLLLILPLLAAANEAANIPIKFAADDSSNSEEMICHPGTPCYPRVFVATYEFQVVKPDQDIPKGLHVRLDVQTGLKEAKIYVPDENDTSTNNLVLVSEDDTPSIPAGAPLEPPPSHQQPKPPKSAAGEQELFDASLASLLSSPSVDTLTPLSDLVHEAYWGAQLTSAPGAVSKLLSLLTSPLPPLRAASALTLGSALSNNLKALSNAVATPLAAPILSALAIEADETAKKRILFLLGQMLRDAGVRADFLAQKGVETLRGVFAAGTGEVRGRVAVVVEDSFLNLEMRSDSAGVEKASGELRGLCGSFQEAVVEQEDERVLSALVALKECEVNSKFMAWVEAYKGEELETLVKGYREKGAGGGRNEL
jgi:nucleotide exchange factor SIL1